MRFRCCLFALVVLLPCQAYAHEGAWGYKDKIFVFWADAGEERDIYAINIESGEMDRLTPLGVEDANGVYSPDGTQIAFFSRVNGAGEIFLMSGDGTGRTNVTQHPASDFNPSWSPNGKKLVFQRHETGSGQIYVMNKDGSGQTNISNNGFSDTNPAWSPDGASIAFISTRTGTHEVFVMNAEGENPAQLTKLGRGARNPKWSPDGKYLAFHTDEINAGTGADKGSIFVFFLEDRSLRELPLEEGYNFNPFFSRDGKRLGYNAWREGSVYVCFFVLETGEEHCHIFSLH